jgi:hypothetical protein
MNKYYLQARLAPTVLTSIPLVVCYFYTVAPFVHEYFDSAPALPTISDISLPFAIVLLLVQLNRLLSKEIFQKFYFKDEINMPSTNYLLHNDSTFTNDIKAKIKQKIFKDFDISLYSHDREISEELGARKQICFAVSQIRVVLKNNIMLFRHNVEYGFFRNLLGGCILAVIFSLTLIIFSAALQNEGLRNFGIFFVYNLSPTHYFF